jgi:hypothetical protein
MTGPDGEYFLIHQDSDLAVPKRLTRGLQDPMSVELSAQPLCVVSELTGTVLDSAQQAALKTYFQSGGVYIGVHSATSALDNDQNYLQAAGGELRSAVPDKQTSSKAVTRIADG